MKEKIKSIKIGFWSALIASLCCLGPLFLVLLGISAVSTAVGIGYYRTYFLAGGILFFAINLAYYIKRKRTLICEGCNSSQEESRRLISVIFLATASFLIIYGLIIYFMVPRIAPVIYQKGNPAKILSSVARPSVNEIEKVNLKIEGMDCAGCAIGIENTLKDLAGVSNAKVEYPQGNGFVEYNPQLIALEKIIEAIKPYKAIVVEK